jgi:DNA-binding PadR family transcriptional regulator
MAKPEFPGAFEMLVLLALVRLGERAYGMTVRQEIEERTGREIALGAVYATLDRFEEKGWVKSVSSPGGAEREGRARRFFKVLAPGMRALEEGLAAVDRMRSGVAGLSGAQG